LRTDRQNDRMTDRQTREVNIRVAKAERSRTNKLDLFVESGLKLPRLRQENYNPETRIPASCAHRNLSTNSLCDYSATLCIATRPPVRPSVRSSRE